MSDALELLASLRWDVDSLVTSHLGERVWLKALVRNGARFGITECCFADEACPHHAELARRYALVEVSP